MAATNARSLRSSGSPGAAMRLAQELADDHDQIWERSLRQSRIEAFDRIRRVYRRMTTPCALLT